MALVQAYLIKVQQTPAILNCSLCYHATQLLKPCLFYCLVQLLTGIL